MKKLKIMLIAAGLMTSLSFVNCYAMEGNNQISIDEFTGKKFEDREFQNRAAFNILRNRLMDEFDIQGLRDRIYELEIYNRRFEKENAELVNKISDQKEKEQVLLNKIENLKKENELLKEKLQEKNKDKKEEKGKQNKMYIKYPEYKKKNK